MNRNMWIRTERSKLFYPQRMLNACHSQSSYNPASKTPLLTLRRLNPYKGHTPQNLGNIVSWSDLYTKLRAVENWYLVAIHYKAICQRANFNLASFDKFKVDLPSQHWPSSQKMRLNFKTLPLKFHVNRRKGENPDSTFTIHHSNPKVRPIQVLL
jgi:hypothetical protein